MPIRAYLVLYRTRLIWCAFVALFVPFAIVLFAASEDGFDFGVFWNHFCGCPPGVGDVVVLLYGSTLTAVVIGLILSLGGFRSGMPFTLTRPMSRKSAFFTPSIIAGLTIVILPALGFAIIFGWLRLAHAPALAFFPRALRLIPSASTLPADASLSTLLIAAHASATYLASVSMGLMAFSIYYAQRWLMLSQNSWIRTAGALQPTLLYFTPVARRLLSPGYSSALYLIPPKQNLAWHPTPLLLFLHYAVPVALLLWSWLTLQATDF
ncbi:MAG: hypothetical protein ACRYFU_15755 [Janthinobacterium lividum]